MPSLPDLDEFPYVGQDEDLPECLPACVAMVYFYSGIDTDIRDLRYDLGFDPQVGTPFENVAELREVEALTVSSLEDVEAFLGGRPPRPVIANLYVVNDELLGYRLEPPLHAVVVVGIEHDTVIFYDPLSHSQRSTQSAARCSRDAFARAWDGGWVLLPRPS